ncbi:tetratricopeptide repeat protein [Pleurocapsales cyanobacterium LEGE 10410]|nr:tetratricopeptide repeat protein [Pleurocapsales cyanobacterium LEGE 10410]
MSKKKNKTLVRIVTLIIGLGFAGSSLAIALSSVFSNNNYSTSSENAGETSLEEQIQLQVRGYETVLAREPKNVAALEGLAQIYLQTDPQKAIPTLEKLVEYYPEQQQYAGILEIVKQQEASQSPETEPPQQEGQ